MNAAPYKKLISGIIIKIVAVLVLLSGIVFSKAMVSLGMSETSESIVKGYINLGCIIVSALLFIISNMAEDIHYTRYISECHRNESSYYQMQSLQITQSIQELLQQQYYPQQAPYNPVPPQYVPTEPAHQQMEHQQRPEFQPPAQSSRMMEKKLRTDAMEDSEFDYRAQYRKLTQNEKKASPSKKEA